MILIYGCVFVSKSIIKQAYTVIRYVLFVKEINFYPDRDLRKLFVRQNDDAVTGRTVKLPGERSR